MRALNRRIALLSSVSILISPRFASASSEAHSNCLLPSPGLPPQDAERHPSLYWETGVEEGFRNLQVGIRKEFVLIIGGTDVNGRSDGVYIARDFREDSTVTIEQLENGFFLFSLDKWAKDEFRFRLDQAGAFNWAKGHVFVPSDWMDDFEDYNPTALEG